MDQSSSDYQNTNNVTDVQASLDNSLGTRMLEPRMVKLMQEGRKTAATASEIRIKSSVNQRAKLSK